MDFRSLKQDVLNQSRSLDSLFELIERLDRRVRQLESENSRLRERLGKYEPEVLKPESTEPSAAGPVSGGDSQDYSLESEEKRRKKRRSRPARLGRVSTEQKLESAQRIEDLFPEGADPKQCEFDSVRVAWRIENGQAVLVGYRLHRDPNGEKGNVPDVFAQGEFDLQIIVALAYLTYIMRLSLDQTCELFQFFWKLPMIKSQADALLNQLARHWKADFERLHELLALAAVVWTDETGWKVAGKSENAAVFASPDHTVLLYGCPKGGETLEKVLPPDVFRGVLVSDDHSSYQGLSRMQKCWAHLLRKAIHLVVLYPEHAVYRSFLDDLLAIYREAQHRREDGRLSESGRRRLADDLNTRVKNLCAPHCWKRVQPARTAHAQDHERLANEIYRLAEVDELFTFVIHLEVPGTNNASEQLLRGAAQSRKLDRTSKSSQGCHRRSVITSVMESLRKQLKILTMEAVTGIVKQWMKTGKSTFARQLTKARRLHKLNFSPG